MAVCTSRLRLYDASACQQGRDKLSKISRRSLLCGLCLRQGEAVVDVQLRNCRHHRRGGGVLRGSLDEEEKRSCDDRSLKFYGLD